MAHTPLDVEVLLRDDLDTVKAELRALIKECQDRLGQLPDDYSEIDDGEILVNGDASTGPTPVSELIAPVSFAGKQIGSFRPERVFIDGPITLNDSEHCGRLLIKRGSVTDGSVLTLSPNADPDVGVSEGFSCSIWRQTAGGEVQVSGDLTNDHPSAHARVQAGGAATITVDVESGVFTLHGATEV